MNSDKCTTKSEYVRRGGHSNPSVQAREITQDSTASDRARAGRVRDGSDDAARVGSESVQSDMVSPARATSASRCWCQWEAGDSPCPMHGEREEDAPPTDPAPPPTHEPSWEEVEEEARPAWPALVGPAAKAMERLWPGSSEPRYLRSLAERAEALSRLREELARLVAMAHGARLTSAPESVIVAGDAAYEALSALQGAVREALGGVR